VPKYSNPVHPQLAIKRFRRRSGNYVVHFHDGSAYAGRQSRNSDRIRVALATWGTDVAAVQFKNDHRDDQCVRAAREENTIVGLLVSGIPLRNRMRAAIPLVCRLRRW
jgi:hypothetical protein